MSEEILVQAANAADLEKIEKINVIIDKMHNKKSKFLFCIPESQGPSASVYEMYFHATTVKNMGYDTYVLVETKDYIIPDWIEEELTQHKHMSMADPALTVGSEDIMIIPEVYSNVMEQTKNLPCLRIGLLQSIDYMVNSLIPGTDWSSFGIRNIITTSQSLVNLIDNFYGKNKFIIQKYNVGIPDYFEKSNMPQKPIISIVGRNANEISKIVKLFFSKYPQYAWVTFDPMLTNSKPPQPMRRVDFAKRLKNNFAAVWTDRISSFGTFPLECMKSGVIPICAKPDLMPDYLIIRDENNVETGLIDGGGVWTDNFYDIPTLIGEILVKFLDDAILPEFYDSMTSVVENYTQKNAENELSIIYQGHVDGRIEEFKKIIASATISVDAKNNDEVKKEN
jgi:hypothetical protein